MSNRKDVSDNLPKRLVLSYSETSAEEAPVLIVGYVRVLKQMSAEEVPVSRTSH